MRSLFVLAALWIAVSAFGQANYLPAIKWRTVAEGGNSKIDRAENRFLHTSGDLQKWWGRHSGAQPGSVPYAFDQSKEFFVAIHLGERASGGFGVFVETVARTTAASAVIAIVEKKPGKGSMTTQAITSPWVLISIERPGVQDWQFKSRTIAENIPTGGSSGCRCCEACIKSCSGIKVYNPAPVGIFSADNAYGVRALGAVPFVQVEMGDDSDVRQPASFVVQSERQFVDYWSRHHREETAPATFLDWRKEQLLAVHLGAAPTTGYKVHVVGIERTWYGTLNVQYAIEQPKSSDRVRRVTTYPYAMVRMSRITEPINFVRRDDLLKNRCECECKKCGCLH